MQAQNDVKRLAAQTILSAMESLRSSNTDFENAYDTYLQQYGKEVIAVNEPLSLAGTIDPVVFVFGQTSFIQFKDSSKEIKGTVGSVDIGKRGVRIIGRRQPQDSKLVLWNSIDNSLFELEEYDARSSYIPSRIHGAFVTYDDGRVEFTDLSSSSGTLIFGERKEGGPFVTIFDPGTANFPRFRVNRISTFRKS